MIMWAIWKTRGGLQFKIPFESYPQAERWLRQRWLLDHAHLEWNSGRSIWLSTTLNRRNVKGR